MFLYLNQINLITLLVLANDRRPGVLRPYMEHKLQSIKNNYKPKANYSNFLHILENNFKPKNYTKLLIIIT